MMIAPHIHRPTMKFYLIKYILYFVYCVKISVITNPLLPQNLNILYLPVVISCRVNVDDQVLSVSVHLPPNYLNYEPFGPGRGVRGHIFFEP